jgi:hypothetical protein
VSFKIIAKEIWCLIPKFFIFHTAILYFDVLSAHVYRIPFHCAIHKVIRAATFLLCVLEVRLRWGELPVGPYSHGDMPLVKRAANFLGSLVDHLFSNSFPYFLLSSLFVVNVI